MTKLWIDDLIDPALLSDMLDSGYVRCQRHPTLPLAILNYSELAQFAREWNPATRQCRGLIYNIDTREIAARCLPKFHNWGEPEVGHVDPTEPVTVTDKLDGSLGLLYDDGDGGAVATRGSFTSAQAIHATTVWKDRYAGTMFQPHPSWTPIFEIIYPANRIVCDYQGADDLYLLGFVSRSTGRLLRPSQIQGWTGPAVEEFDYPTLAAALAAPPRPGKEGFVVDLLHRAEHVKIKQADYVELHKIITGLNERVVWEQIGAGKTVAELCAPLPDEFHLWVAQVAERLTTEMERTVAEAEAAHAAILASLPEGWTRKDYALNAVSSSHRAVLFQLLDGRDPRPGIWRSLRPSGAVSMTGYSEDVA